LPISDVDIFALPKTLLKDLTVHFFVQRVGHIEEIITQVTDERARLSFL